MKIRVLGTCVQKIQKTDGQKQERRDDRWRCGCRHRKQVLVYVYIYDITHVCIIIRSYLGAEDLYPLVVAVGGLSAVVNGGHHPVLEGEHRQARVDVTRLPDGRVDLKKLNKQV